MSIEPYSTAPAGTDLGLQTNLMVWASQADKVHRIATALAGTKFVPTSMFGKPDEVAAQILFGNDVGLPPMVALQQIHMIENRPSMSALSMRGLAQSRGIKFRYEEMTETRCRVAALAPGDTNWTTVTWTFDRAKKLGLVTKTNWTKQPQAMLIARATAEVCRLVAAPLFLGLSYSTEELRDGGNDLPEAPAGDEAPAPEPAKRTIKRAQQVKPDPVPAAVPDQPTEELPDDPDGGPVTEWTRKALLARFIETDIRSRDDRLEFVGRAIGRGVDGINDLTEAEGRLVLEQLHADYGQPEAVAANA